MLMSSPHSCTSASDRTLLTPASESSVPSKRSSGYHAVTGFPTSGAGGRTVLGSEGHGLGGATRGYEPLLPLGSRPPFSARRLMALVESQYPICSGTLRAVAQINTSCVVIYCLYTRTKYRSVEWRSGSLDR